MALDTSILISAAWAVPAPTNAMTERPVAMAMAAALLMDSSKIVAVNGVVETKPIVSANRWDGEEPVDFCQEVCSR
jgi:hypothetical protein